MMTNQTKLMGWFSLLMGCLWSVATAAPAVIEDIAFTAKPGAHWRCV